MARKYPQPANLQINFEPRQPETSPTLGGNTDRSAGIGEPVHRLVTIGDSITQGFMSAAVFHTDLSWPAIVAYELGVRPGTPAARTEGSVGEFRFPVYEKPDGPGGLPLDLERAIRGLERRVGEKLSWWEVVTATYWVQRYMDAIEEYWERGPGSHPPARDVPYHNLAVYGADLLDVQFLTVENVSRKIGKATDDPIKQVVEHDNDRAWQWVLNSCKDQHSKGLSVLQAAKAMGDDGLTGGGNGPGIETLVVMLGSNNALGSVVNLEPRWTQDDYGQKPLAERLDSKGEYNIWQPSHFNDEWAALVGPLREIRARHVIISTVPAVTIAPIARGVKGKVRQGSRYFANYTRPWIDDERFDARDPHITADEARAIDSAIDAYNHTIIQSVRDARAAGLDWYLFDLGGLLDRLAARRYDEDPSSRPAWWTPYPLPPELSTLSPKPDSRFFQSGEGGRTTGGLFSLDGVHPTTIGAGLIAHEIIKIMRDNAGVRFYTFEGQQRPKTVGVDFARVLKSDSLVGRPPTNLSSTLHMLGWLDSTFDWVRALLPFH